MAFKKYSSIEKINSNTIIDILLQTFVHYSFMKMIERQLHANFFLEKITRINTIFFKHTQSDLCTKYSVKTVFIVCMLI